MTKSNSKKKPERLKSQIVIDWIESNLFIPEGKHVGKPFKLASFQKETIRLIYDNPAGTRRAIISFPRKNAKSTLVACLMLVHLCGPLAVRNGQLFSAARTREQASLLFIDLLLVFGIAVMGALLLYPHVLVFFGLDDEVAPLVIMALGLSFEKIIDAIMGTSKVEVPELLLKWLK